MNLKIIELKKRKAESALIGKTGFLRIPNRLASILEINKNEQWLCSVNLDEKPFNYIYIYKSNKDNVYLGKKMMYNNSSWSLNMGPVISELKLKTPIKLHIERFSYERINGFKLKLL